MQETKVDKWRRRHRRGSSWIGQEMEERIFIRDATTIVAGEQEYMELGDAVVVLKKVIWDCDGQCDGWKDDILCDGNKNCVD